MFYPTAEITGNALTIEYERAQALGDLMKTSMREKKRGKNLRILNSQEFQRLCESLARLANRKLYGN